MLIQVILGLGVILFLILYLIERKSGKELFLLNNKKKVVEYYAHKISEIEDPHLENSVRMEKIRTVSKKLFNDYYNLDLNESYSNLIDFFSKRNLKDLVEFSEIMLKYYYKEEQVNEEIVKRLISILKNESKHIPLKEEDLKEMEEYSNNKKHVEKETQLLLEEIKEHIKGKQREEAEETYEKLEKIQENNPKKATSKKMSKLYDKIIGLYYDSKRKTLKNKASEKFEEKEITPKEEIREEIKEEIREEIKEKISVKETKTSKKGGKQIKEIKTEQLHKTNPKVELPVKKFNTSPKEVIKNKTEEEREKHLANIKREEAEETYEKLEKIQEEKPSIFSKINNWIEKRREESKKRAENREKLREEEKIIREEERKRAIIEKVRMDKKNKIEEDKSQKVEKATASINEDETLKSKIKVLLLQAQNYADLHMDDKAIQAYSKIKELYSNLNNKDKDLYDKIIVFYKKELSNLEQK